MKKIGIVGGVAWLSTIEYYKAICDFSERHHQGQVFNGAPPMPEMAIESVNMNYSFGVRGVAGDDASWSRFDAYFNAALKRLEASGCEFAIIASNTPHNRYHAITRGINIPVLSIFEVVAEECKRQRIEKILILGTAPTMSSMAFPNVLQAHRIEGGAPKSDEDKSLTVDVISQLQAGKPEGMAAKIHSIVSRAFPAEYAGRKVACLACTELPLAFPQFADAPTFEADGVLYVNTTIIHAKAAFDFAISSGPS
jgi:aspartate racemase